MTPLRQQMIQDVKLRNLAPRTIQSYVTRVARFAPYFARSPDEGVARVQSRPDDCDRGFPADDNEPGSRQAG